MSFVIYTDLKRVANYLIVLAITHYGRVCSQSAEVIMTCLSREYIIPRLDEMQKNIICKNVYDRFQRISDLTFKSFKSFRSSNIFGHLFLSRVWKKICDKSNKITGTSIHVHRTKRRRYNSKSNNNNNTRVKRLVVKMISRPGPRTRSDFTVRRFRAGF